MTVIFYLIINSLHNKPRHETCIWNCRKSVNVPVSKVPRANFCSLNVLQAINKNMYVTVNTKCFRHFSQCLFEVFFSFLFNFLKIIYLIQFSGLTSETEYRSYTSMDLITIPELASIQSISILCFFHRFFYLL